MRVLLDCRMAAWSGIGRYTTGLARALAARDDVELVELRGPDDTALAGAIIARAHPFGIHGALELARLAQTAKVDLLHCPHFPTPLPARGALVVTLHDLIPLVVPGVMPSALKRGAYRLWNTRAARVADRVIVPSASTGRDVERLLPAARGKLRVIPEAADDFSRGPVGPVDPHGPLGERLGRMASAPYLLSMGNTKPHKDLPSVLRAFAEVATGREDLRLMLVGPEPPGYMEEHMRAISPAVRTRVAFTGPVDDAELRALYIGATAVVFPSLYEGFGLPVLEAMALGAPVVCSDAASLPEVAGEAAVQFPAGDAAALATSIGRVLDDPGLREELARRGLERAAEFSWDKTAAATVAVYEEALACT